MSLKEKVRDFVNSETFEMGMIRSSMAVAGVATALYTVSSFTSGIDVFQSPVSNLVAGSAIGIGAGAFVGIPAGMVASNIVDKCREWVNDSNDDNSRKQPGTGGNDKSLSHKVDHTLETVLQKQMQQDFMSNKNVNQQNVVNEVYKSTPKVSLKPRRTDSKNLSLHNNNDLDEERSGR